MWCSPRHAPLQYLSASIPDLATGLAWICILDPTLDLLCAPALHQLARGSLCTGEIKFPCLCWKSLWSLSANVQLHSFRVGLPFSGFVIFISFVPVRGLFSDHLSQGHRNSGLQAARWGRGGNKVERGGNRMSLPCGSQTNSSNSCFPRSVNPYSDPAALRRERDFLFV